MKSSSSKVRAKKFDESASDLKKGGSAEYFQGNLGTGKTPNCLRLTMWNVNGIRSVLNKNAMQKFIKDYEEPDFICINETKIDAEGYAKERIKLPGYNDYWNFCKCSAGYSGVAVFTKFPPISRMEDLEEAAYSQEGRVLTLEYEQFYLVVVYVPSAGSKIPGKNELERLHYKVQKYEVAFHRHCEKLRGSGKGVVVCGDLNVSLEPIDIHVTNFTHKQPGYTA
jgi:exodeoxyribonuclease III